jgi:MYXO-CTERM domain-containing protein
MTRITSTLAAALAAFLLAAPAAGAVDRRVEQALAQERTYTQQATVASTPRHTAPAQDDGAPTVLIAGAVTGALALLGAGTAAVRRRRRPVSAAVA